MAPKAHSKSAPATTPTDAATKSELAPRIGEYVLRASEVAKLTDTLQELLAAIVQTQDIVRLKHAIGDNVDKAYKVLADKKAEVYKTLFGTWAAIAGLYDVIKLHPPEFENVAASLVGVVSVIKGIYQIPDDDFERQCESFRWLLHTATNRLYDAISELLWHLFPTEPALPDDENPNGGGSLTDRYKRAFYCMAVIAEQYGIPVKLYGTDWLHVARELQKKDPDAPEWRNLTEESDDFSVEKAGWLYLERKYQEQFDAKTDANHQKLLEAIVAAMPAVALADVDAALSKLKSDAEHEAEMICRLQEVCLPSDASNYKSAAKIALMLDKWKKVDDRCREIHRLVGYRPEATAEQIAAALEPPLKKPRQTVGRTKFWSDFLVLRAKIKEDTKLAERGAKDERWNEN